LAVDALGYAYVTSNQYFVDSGTQQASLTKLNLWGSELVFTVPIGGIGVAIDAAGNVYAGGWASGVQLIPLIFLVEPTSPPPGYAR
jgi:hypothetical protein